MAGFFETLRIQRWDDHRYYHHSRINQSLHLVIAVSFLIAYVMLFKDPAISGLIGWLISMTSRQSGHFFFEPHSYDHVNHATHDHKEEIKVGYNLQRKVVLMTIWVLSPALLLIDPTLLGIFKPHASFWEFARHTGLIWLFLAIGGVLFRTVHLFFIYGVQAGLAWAFKILTDPFHDVKIYWKSPYWLLWKGQLIDPMEHVHHGIDGDEDEEEPAIQSA